MEREKDHFLFVHFAGESKEGEQVYFAVSKDGMHWEDLHGQRPVLRSCIGEKGVRDPFILRSELDGNFYIIATDLRIASGKGWEVAQHAGSTDLVIWRSGDLVNWSAPWAVNGKVEGAGCVWAPEAIYDPEQGAYLVFWASCVKEEGEREPKQRIYCAYTKNFEDFSGPEKYIERDHHVIDTTIVEQNGMFYRFSKDETTKNIRMDRGRSLRGAFEEIPSACLQDMSGVEGPAAFWLPKAQMWCVLVDRFAQGLGYLPLLCRDLDSGAFCVADAGQYDMGRVLKRHGSVLAITQKEYETLRERFG